MSSEIKNEDVYRDDGRTRKREGRITQEDSRDGEGPLRAPVPNETIGFRGLLSS